MSQTQSTEFAKVAMHPTADEKTGTFVQFPIPYHNVGVHHIHPLHQVPLHRSNLVPFYTVNNPIQHAPLDHYHQLRQQLDEIMVPAMSVLQQQMAVPHGIDDKKDSVLVCMDVHQFGPEELNVTMKDDYLVIEGKHEERHDGHGMTISRTVVRRMHIPEEVDRQAINCNVSCDGILEISVPKKIQGDRPANRSILIHFTGRPAAGPDPVQVAAEDPDVVGGGLKHLIQEDPKAA